MLLADEMGLGKTVQALALAVCYAAEWFDRRDPGLLLVAPKSLKLKWADDCEAWLPFLRPDEIRVLEHAHEADDVPPLPARVTIVAPKLLEILTASHPGWKARRWPLVVVDESGTVMRSGRSLKKTSAQTQNLHEVLRLADRRLLLSGTPLSSRAHELWHQVDAVAPGLLGTTPRGFDPGYTAAGPHWAHLGRDPPRLPELHVLLKATCMLRRTNAEVLAELPPLLTESHVVLGVEWESNRSPSARAAVACDRDLCGGLRQDDGESDKVKLTGLPIFGPTLRL